MWEPAFNSALKMWSQISLETLGTSPYNSCDSSLEIGAIGALMNIVLQPRPLLVLGLNVWMGTDAGADAASRGPLQRILTRTKVY